MSEALTPLSPLAEFLASRSSRSVTEPGISISERPFLGYFNLRAESSDEWVARVEKVSGIRVPLKPNTCSEAGDFLAMWLGPNEWLLITPPGTDHFWGKKLLGEGLLASFVDVSHGYDTVRLSGPKVLDVLGKGCSLDLDPSVFPQGSCAQTLLAKAQIIIRIADGLSCFDLIIRRSFAEYVALWLEDASQEYGYTIS